jgi:hypothetical protein
MCKNPLGVGAMRVLKRLSIILYKNTKTNFLQLFLLF